MGAIISNLNLPDKYFKKPRDCFNCKKPIDPDVNLMQLWCNECDNIWCNDCWNSSLESLTKTRFDVCGYCYPNANLYIKSLLYDIIIEKADPDFESKLIKEYCDDNLKEKLLEGNNIDRLSNCIELID